MKKLAFCLCALLTMFATTASAERVVFKSPNFNFGDYKIMQITNISVLNVYGKDFVSDNGVDSKVLIGLRGALAKKDVVVRTPEQIPASTPGTRSLTTIPEVSIKVYCMGYDNIYREAWTEQRTVMEEINASWGWGIDKEARITVPKTITIQHPAGYYRNAELDIEINVIKPLNKEVVYTVRDSRGEGDSTNTIGLLNDAMKAFVKDIK